MHSSHAYAGINTRTGLDMADEGLPSQFLSRKRFFINRATSRSWVQQ